MALALVAGIAVSTGSGASAAVLPALPPSTQFDITGFLQVATLDQAYVLTEVATGGTAPQEVAFDGSHIWVSNSTSGNVSKIDPEAGVVTGTVATGVDPQGIDFDGTNIWVANSNSALLSRLLP